jgi:muramoyltetrapeptide carboxypeptidase
MSLVAALLGRFNRRPAPRPHRAAKWLRQRNSLGYVSPVLFPPPLSPGDRIAVVAPSSPFDREAALAGIAWLKERYRVVFRPTLFARTGFLAGSDQRRIAELQNALDTDVRAVVAARGGYGLSRIAERIDWRRAFARPRWIVGFSDITVLHAEAWRRRLASIHGAMVCTLGGGDEAVRSAWIEALEVPQRERSFTRLAVWRRGDARGTLVGGNLAMLHACAAAGRLRVPRGAVVLVEDIGERPYRVDRMLSNLITGGHLTKASAVLVGSFTDCSPGPDGTRVEDVLRERLRTLGVPVLADVPVGHGARNEPVVLGSRAEVSTGRSGTVMFRA